MPRQVSRREALRLGAGAFGAALTAPLLASCSLETDEGTTEGGDGDTLLFVSTQLAPTEEAEKLRREILADYEGTVEFIGEEIGPFFDRVAAEAQGGQGSIGLLGGLHGEFSTLAEDDLLTDVTGLLDELSDRNFIPQFLELARLGGDQAFYVPWMQASYIMVARQEAMDLIPASDPAELTYEQWLEWGEAIERESGSGRLGFPGGPDGLLKRFHQGYSYPSFTGGVNTTFASPEAATMWEWMNEAWALSNPQSANYAFMQEPLMSGEVWVAWDHTARLVEALRSDPEGFVAFPPPSGPQGRGYMPVVAGLAIPANAPNPEASRRLVTYLTEPSTAQVTLQQVAFFPPFEAAEIGDDLEAAVQAEAETIQATIAADDALPSLLPVGLGDQGGIYDEVFAETFERITLDGETIQTVLVEQAGKLQEVFDQTGAPCWSPDPEGQQACRVGQATQ